MMPFDKRRVIGRKIVDVRLNPFQSDPNHPRSRAHDAVIVLDNGAEIGFLVQETEIGEYGVYPVLRPRTRKGVK